MQFWKKLSAAGLILFGLGISQFSSAEILVSHAWIRAVPPMMTSSSAYFHITNNSGQSVFLIKAQFSGAYSAEIHESKMENGLMKMGHKEDPIEIRPGKTIMFEPAGLHLMLMQLNESLNVGDIHNIELEFNNNQFVTFPAPVQMDESNKQ